MDRVTDITKIKLPEGNVLIKINIKESEIILLEGSNAANDADFAEIILVTDKIEDLEVGDIVLDFESSAGMKWEGGTYAIVPRWGIRIAVSPEYFLQTHDISK